MKVPVSTDTIWKFIATGTLSALMTLAGSYWTREAKAVSAAEVHSMIQTQSPYISDRKVILQMVDDVREMRKDVAQLGRELSEIKGTLDSASRGRQ